jgi:hypothetical protein
MFEDFGLSFAYGYSPERAAGFVFGGFVGLSQVHFCLL